MPEVNIPPRLARAKGYLAIAESADSKREAYKMACEEIAAELQHRSQRDVARDLVRDESYVRALMRWRDSGYKAATPWMADENATTRASDSHARKTVRERPQVIEDEFAKASPEAQASMAKKLLSNPDVAMAVMKDWDVAKVIDQADQKIGRETMEKVADKSRAETPNLASLHDYARAGILLAQARVRIAEALKHMMAMPNMSETVRDGLQRRVNAITDTVGWCDSFLKSGSKSFDDELAAILAGADNPDN